MAITLAATSELTAAVTKIYSLCIPFSFFGRGYPDIAAQALNFEIFFNNVTTVVHGTPCAVSVSLSLLSLILSLCIVYSQAPI